MTSTLIGEKWITKLLNSHPEKFHNTFCMSQSIFLDLLTSLESCHGLHGSSKTTTKEVLALILYVLSHNKSIRATSEQF